MKMLTDGRTNGRFLHMLYTYLCLRDADKRKQDVNYMIYLIYINYMIYLIYITGKHMQAAQCTLVQNIYIYIYSKKYRSKIGNYRLTKDF